MGSPPPAIENVQKKAPKNYPKTFGFGLDPPPPFGQCPKGSSFFLRTTSLSQQVIEPSVIKVIQSFRLSLGHYVNQ